jgi:hypothetical protein
LKLEYLKRFKPYLYWSEPKRTKEESLDAPVASVLEIKNTFPELYRKVRDDPVSRARLFEKAKAEENRYRELFAQERDSPELENPHILLINPHKDEDIFR